MMNNNKIYCEALNRIEGNLEDQLKSQLMDAKQKIPSDKKESFFKKIETSIVSFIEDPIKIHLTAIIESFVKELDWDLLAKKKKLSDLFTSENIDEIAEFYKGNKDDPDVKKDVTDFLNKTLKNNKDHFINSLENNKNPEAFKILSSIQNISHFEKNFNTFPMRRINLNFRKFLILNFEKKTNNLKL